MWGECCIGECLGRFRTLAIAKVSIVESCVPLSVFLINLCSLDENLIGVVGMVSLAPVMGKLTTLEYIKCVVQYFLFIYTCSHFFFEI